MRNLLSVDTVKSLGAPWWGAIAGGAAAGATILSDSRLLGGAIGAAGMYVVAVYLAGPCCASCAGASPPAPAAKPAATGNVYDTDGDGFTSAAELAAATSGGCK